MDNLFEDNLRLLAAINLNWVKRVIEVKQPGLKIKPSKTISGDTSFEIIKNGRRLFLHSNFDPVKEARRFARQINEGDSVVIYGFGLGYHVEEVLNRIGSEGTVNVIETNLAVFREALSYLDLKKFLNDDRLNLFLESHLGLVAKKLAELIEHVDQEDSQLLIHRPSLELVPEELTPVREHLLVWQAKNDSLKRFGRLLEENIRNNMLFTRELPSVSQFFNKYVNKPLLLVATGPSLDANMEYIRRYRDKFLVLAVGSALTPLEKAGLGPDMAIITDPQEKVIQQIEGLKLEVPLILLLSVHPKVFSKYKGPKIIGYQKGIDSVEQLAMERGVELINTGGSVVTTALDIAIRMGFNPIMFIGLDLSYPFNRTHAGGTMYGDINTSNTSDLFAVKNYRGETVMVPPNLISYRKWIESRIKKVDKEIRFYNLSPNGTCIKGVPYKSWVEVFEGCESFGQIRK